MAPPPIHPHEDKSRTMSLEDDDFSDSAQKDFSHKLSVFHVYKNKKNFTESGFFNGGLDTGVEPSLLAVEFDTKENLADRLMNPFPMTSKVLPPEVPLTEHENYTKKLMYQTL